MHNVIINGFIPHKISNHFIIICVKFFTKL